MDRISALRNVEDALRRFEDGEVALSELEREVRGTLRTYATEFEGDLAAYRAESTDGAGGESGNSAVDGTVVLAGSKQGARERVRALVDRPGPFAVERFERD
ncbi:hypothetical protein C475_04426 [Halosimplex carlsbadense 2-9-1]|uniref:Uncharacterized protein n=1 Tax=Halosimplex carlsbadense 2-9-1 TaxID=797114 RepID=M0D1W5_9EURY|nr:hypothetical protein [Halosimplex carlsbadense]ELZ28853.1 hypothetical protein C475_04426 [Halosimplex carlsbadense 2-9-1]